MKTLVNKSNQHIRITAPEIEKILKSGLATYSIGGVYYLLQSEWTLVEEEPENLKEAAIDYADKELNKPKGYAIAAKADWWNGCVDGFMAGWRQRGIKGNLEEKPTIIETIQGFIEKGERCMEQAFEDHDQGNYIFWDGFHNCAEGILREVEEPTEIEELGKLSFVDRLMERLSKMSRGEIDELFKEYELGRKERKK